MPDSVSYCVCFFPFSRVLAPSLSSPLHQSFFSSLNPPPHSYTRSPLSFGALQWLHHHIGDTTALANEVSLSFALSLSLFYVHTLTRSHTHTHTCFSPNFLSLSLFCSQKAYRVPVKQSLENEPNCNLSHFHIKSCSAFEIESAQIARPTCRFPHARATSFRSPVLLKWLQGKHLFCCQEGW